MSNSSSTSRVLEPHGHPYAWILPVFILGRLFFPYKCCCPWWHGCCPVLYCAISYCTTNNGQRSKGAERCPSCSQEWTNRAIHPAFIRPQIHFAESHFGPFCRLTLWWCTADNNTQRTLVYLMFLSFYKLALIYSKTQLYMRTLTLKYQSFHVFGELWNSK